MIKGVCSDCGKDCEVPFKPTEGRLGLLQGVSSDAPARPRF
ncbi:MAG: CxxC-x17-CxxC domain-containing protein [Methanoregulaceae archaeon]